MATILVVDDSKFERDALRKMLEEAGHQVVGEAEDGVEAYLQYLRLQPDLVTMDVEMPRMDGIRALRKILYHFTDAKIVMISGNTERGSVMRSIWLGAKNFIVKPVAAAKLNQIIDSVLGGGNKKTSSAPQ